MTPRQRAEAVVEEYRQSVMTPGVKKDLSKLIAAAIGAAIKETKLQEKRRRKINANN